MSIEKWWTPDTIFMTAMGLVMAVMLTGSVMLRPFVSKSGSALIPVKALQQARADRVECETMSTDMDLAMHLHTHC